MERERELQRSGNRHHFAEGTNFASWVLLSSSEELCSLVGRQILSLAVCGVEIPTFNLCLPARHGEGF